MNQNSKLIIIVSKHTLREYHPIVAKKIHSLTKNNLVVWIIKLDIGPKKFLLDDQTREMVIQNNKNEFLNFYTICLPRFLPFQRFRFIQNINEILFCQVVKSINIWAICHLRQKASDITIWFFHPNLYSLLSKLIYSIKPRTIVFDTLDLTIKNKKQFPNYFSKYKFTGLIKTMEETQKDAFVIPWGDSLKSRLNRTVTSINTELN